MTFYKTVKAIAARSESTIVQDAIGAAALVVLLVGGLYIPGLV